MHIVYPITSMHFGGAQKIALGLAEEAIHAGHRATIISICKGNDYEQRLREKNVGYYSLSYGGRFKLRSVPVIATLRSKLLKLIKELRPDIIHSQLFIPKVLLYGLSNVYGIPVISTQQDNCPWWFKNDLNSRVQTHIEKVFAKKTSIYTVAISESVKNDVVRIFGINGDQTPVINNFIEDVSPNKHPVLSGSSTGKIFMVTRIDIHKKGLDTALDILQEVRKSIPECTLTVIGDGPDKERFISMVNERKLEIVVFTQDYTADVYSKYSEADIVLMPSRWEGFGITAAEAAIIGVPVVASRVGGLQEVVVDGQTGFTCKPEDIVEFSECIIKLLKDKNLYTTISKQAKELALQRFDRKKAFQQYEALYRKIVNG